MAKPRTGEAAVGSASHDATAINQQSNSAWINARRNFNYLFHPSSADRPGRFRTRALLRTVRYVTQFVFWRLVRWAKYAAIAGLVAAVSASAFGGVISGVGWLVAPPSIGASFIAFGIWSTGKFAARKLHSRWQVTGMNRGEELREQSEDQQIKMPEPLGLESGPRSMPW